MELKHLIRHYGGLLPPHRCKEVIDWANTVQSTHYKNDTYDFNQINVNEHWPDLAMSFAKIVSQVSEDYFKSLGFSEYVTPQGFEQVRIKKYVQNAGQEFRNHVDVIDHATAKRYLIAILYLNDNNGVTDFPHLGVSVKPSAGSMVLFPPMWMFPHAGRPPTDHDKYIMMTSLNYV